MEMMEIPKIPTFDCECGKKFISYSGLWKHKKKCDIYIVTCDQDDINYTNEIIDITDVKMLTNIVVEVVKQNKELVDKNNELTNKIVDIFKTNSKNNISNNNVNSHNKTFNLNVFLNETCKDAMNMSDFIESLQLQISDLEKVGELGYIEGISSIIIKNLNALDITQRPVHCTDKKRETMFIKDQNEWIKETPGWDRLHKLVKKVSNKNINLIQNYKDAHPDCMKSNSKYSDQFNKIIVESMGGAGDNDFEKEEKIIKKIAREVTIDKSDI
jgi:hypothetical protein